MKTSYSKDFFLINPNRQQLHAHVKKRAQTTVNIQGVCVVFVVCTVCAQVLSVLFSFVSGISGA